METIEKTNLNKVWEKVASLLKYFIGDVNVPEHGTLLEQILTHEENLVLSANGIHGLRYDVSAKKLYAKDAEGTEHEIELGSGGSASDEQLQEALTLIQHNANTISSLQRSDLQMAMVLQTLTDADVIDSNNMVIEDFKDIQGITLVGLYDSTNKLVYA